MRTFTVFWHFVGNHGAYIRDAESAEAACRSIILGFSDEFAQKATLVAVEGAHRMRPASSYINVDRPPVKPGFYLEDGAGKPIYEFNDEHQIVTRCDDPTEAKRFNTRQAAIDWGNALAGAGYGFERDFVVREVR